MYKKGDLCVINSKTSHNNGRLVEVVGYTKGKCKNILQVKIRSKVFNITEESLKPASRYDIIRNLSDKQLKRMLCRWNRKFIYEMEAD